MRLSGIGYKILKPALIAFALTLFALPALAALVSDFPTTQIGTNQPCIGINYRIFTPNTNGTFEKMILHDLNIKYSDDGVSSGIYLYENNIMIDMKGGANSYTSNEQEKTILFNDNFTAGKNYRIEFNKSGLPATGCDIGYASYSGAIAYYDTTPPPTPMYLCSGNSCVRDDVNGTYTEPNCNNECAAPPATTSYAFATPPVAAGNLLAAVNSQLGDTGTLSFVILAAAIILGFWGMEKLLDLMPKDKK